MCTKTHTGVYTVVIQYPKYTKVHPVGIVIISKAKGVVRIQPAVVSMAAGIGFMQNGVLCKFRIYIRQVVIAYGF